MISLIVTCRENSKYLAKFMMAFLEHTRYYDQVELLVFIPPTDTWNQELLDYFTEAFPNHIKRIDDNTNMGRGNSNIFYNEAAKEATGDWLWYLCDDHYLLDGYDKYISDYIKDLNIDPTKVNVIAPACSNSGRVSHILSRKTFELVGFGQHGNVDSYINEMLEYVEIFADRPMPYTPPEVIMSDLGIEKDLMKTVNRPDFDEAEQIALFKSEGMKKKIHDDGEKLRSAL